MPLLTVGQAVRNAIDAERAAACFYARLALQTSDPKAKKFLLDMVSVEQLHAGEVEAMARNLIEEPSAIASLPGIDMVETAPEWLSKSEIDLEQALQIALECETQASSYYDALARHFRGSASLFFRGLADMEQAHAQMVKRVLADRQLAAGGAATVEQLISQVIASEHAAQDFYEKMLARVTDPSAKKFFTDMVSIEAAHADSIGTLRQSLQAGSLAIRSAEPVRCLAAAPSWFYSDDEELENLLKMAVDSENVASRFYLAVAEQLNGEEAEVLREMGLAEEEHGRILWDALRHRFPPLQ